MPRRCSGRGRSSSTRNRSARTGARPMRTRARECDGTRSFRSGPAPSPSQWESCGSCEFSEMKLGVFSVSGSEPQTRIGRVQGDTVVDLGPGSSVLERLGEPQGEVAAADVQWHLPFAVADYVDFYSSLEHATNMGRMFRPDQEPLTPNWRRLPTGYHGRAGTVVVSGTEIRRPHGQCKSGDFGPSQKLDFELELGFVIGRPSRLGEPVPVERALEHVFGAVLVNDWSARDIQAFEYVPLGPFLGKSFATSISPWVTTLDELSQTGGVGQDPEPLDYLRIENFAYDIP